MKSAADVMIKQNVTPMHSIATSSAIVPSVLLEGVHLTLDGPAGPVNILRGVDLTVPQGLALGVLNGSCGNHHARPSGGKCHNPVWLFDNQCAHLQRRLANFDHIANFDGHAIGQ